MTVPLHADALLDVGYRDPSANLMGDYVGGGGGSSVVVKDSSGGVVVVRPPLRAFREECGCRQPPLPPPPRAPEKPYPHPPSLRPTRRRTATEDVEMAPTMTTMTATCCWGRLREDGSGGGVTVPLHADALLDVGYRDPSANLTGDYVGGGGGGSVVVKDSSGGVVVVRPLADQAVVLEFDFASGAGALPPPTGRS